MEYEEVQNLIDLDITPKHKFWQCSILFISVSTLAVSIVSMGNIIYAYQYLHEHDYSHLLKNISKIVHKACEEFQC
jgi:hypothetical protein